MILGGPLPDHSVIPARLHPQDAADEAGNGSAFAVREFMWKQDLLVVDPDAEQQVGTHFCAFCHPVKQMCFTLCIHCPHPTLRASLC